MAQSGFTPIQLYHTSTALAVPAAGDMVQGELAINITDGKLYFKDASNNVTLLAVAGGAGSGTVTSVAASGGTTGLTFSGSPIITAGTLTLGGTLGTNNGGTGQNTYTDGQLLIGNTSTGGLSKATLTAGSGVTITNGAGTITIAATGGGGGSVSAVTATFPATSTGGAAPDIGIAHGSGACTTTTGTGALVFSNSPTFTTPNLGTPSAITLTNGTGLPLSTGTTGTLGISRGGNGLTTTPANGQIDIGNGSGFTRSTITAGTGINVSNGAGSITVSATNNGTVTSVSGTGSVSGITLSGNVTSSGSLTLGGSLSLSSGQVTSALGYTPYNSTNPSGYITSSALTGYALLNGTQTFSGANTFSQAVSVSYSGSSSALNNNSVQFQSPGTGVAYFSNAVNIVHPGATWQFNVNTNCFNSKNTTTWDTTSDINIKTNLRPISDALGKLCSLQPKHFEYKNEIGKTRTGFIAQEFATVFPGHVTDTTVPEQYKQFVNGAESIKSISVELFPYLVKAIQELKAELDTAKAKIAALEAK